LTANQQCLISNRQSTDGNKQRTKDNGQPTMKCREGRCDKCKARQGRKPSKELLLALLAVSWRRFRQACQCRLPFALTVTPVTGHPQQDTRNTKQPTKQPTKQQQRQEQAPKGGKWTEKLRRWQTSKGCRRVFVARRRRVRSS
jgi:hypothetical protein